jgi:outer membrane protein OmpA-like peptidoglycan-associated protein
MAQIGKCSNRVGCTLAYTGQEIRFEGSPVCPECGQPLTEIAKPRKSSKLWLLILIPIIFLAIAAVGFYAVERYLVAADSTKATPTATPQVSVAQNDGKMVDGKSQIPADVLSKANNQSSTPQPTVSAGAPTPTATPSPVTQQSPPGPTESPAPSNGGKPPQTEASPAEGKTPPGPDSSPENPRHGNASPQKSPPAGDNSGQTVDTNPKELSSAEVEATKQDVLKRINALPKMSESEKSKLSDKVETARYMLRVGVVYFDKGSNELSKTSIEKLASLFKVPEIVEKMSDPTLVFIVAGYADLGGDPRGNLKLSDERAQAVSNAMSDNAGVINLVRTVGMGGTDLLSSRRADQNRAVEIWAVIP